jgi:hypothetical protein
MNYQELFKMAKKTIKYVPKDVRKRLDYLEKMGDWLIEQRRIRLSGEGLEALPLDTLNDEYADIISAGIFLKETYDQLREIKTHFNWDDSQENVFPEYEKACNVLRNYFRELTDVRNRKMIERGEYDFDPEDYKEGGDK